MDRFASYRVSTLRVFILSQKVFVAASYALFIIMFYSPELVEGAANGGKGLDGEGRDGAKVWACFAAITALGCGVM